MVLVLSESEPKSGSINTAKTLSSAIIAPDKVWLRPNLLTSIIGTIESYACQNTLIKKNAKHTGLFEKSVVLNSDFRSFIRGNKGRMQFDIVFLDPPYAMKVLHETVEKLEEAEMIREKGIVICESDDPTPIEVAGYSLRRHARYGRVYITVLVKEGGEEDAE